MTAAGFTPTLAHDPDYQGCTFILAATDLSSCTNKMSVDCQTNHPAGWDRSTFCGQAVALRDRRRRLGQDLRRLRTPHAMDADQPSRVHHCCLDGEVKRAGFLARRTPMPQGQQLVRATIPRRRKPMSSKPTPRKVVALAEVRAAKAIIWVRCQGRCEMCGRQLEERAWEFCHRVQVGAGGHGLNTVANGLASCPGPTGCNQRLSADAHVARAGRLLGFILGRQANPLTHPVHIHGRGWVLLDDGGGITPARKPYP